MLSTPLSFVLVMILVLILLYFSSTGSLRIVGYYVVYVMSENGVWGATQIFMLPLVYVSIIFLIFSINHLRKNIEDSFGLVRHSLSLTETESQTFVKKQLKHILSHKASIFAFITALAIIWLELIPIIQVRLVYINWPVLTYFLLVYFIIAFFAARVVWLFLASSFAIFSFSKTRFQVDLEKISNWLRSDIIGGIRPLSDLSLRLIEFYVIGVAIFASAPIIYGFYLYALYLFVVLIVGTFTFFVLQFLLHKTIKREKKRLLDLAEKTFSGKAQVVYTAAIEQIKEWPVDLNIVLGLFISSILWPLVAWYLSLLLQELFKFF